MPARVRLRLAPEAPLRPGESAFESEELLKDVPGPEGKVDADWDAGWETASERWLRRLKKLLLRGGRTKAA